MEVDFRPKKIIGLLRSKLMLMGFLVFIALVLRVALFHYTSSDLEIFLFDWFDYYEKVPFLKALRNPISNYTGPYNYLLFITKTIQIFLDHKFGIEIADIAMIKMINLPFEALALFSSLAIVYFFRQQTQKLFMAFSLVLFYPILVLNGAFWGQCDIIYVSFLLASFAFILYEHPILSVVFFGIALTFKFQAMFFAPFLLSLFIRKQIKWYLIGLVLIVYLILHLPSLIAGRSFIEVILIYFAQAESMPVITANAPNIYQFLALPSSMDLLIIQIVGVVIAVSTGIMFAFLFAKRNLHISSKTDLIGVSLSLILMPYLLPSMLDRYFFAAELFLILLAVIDSYLWYLPTLTGLASLCAYYNSYQFLTLPINAWPVKFGAVLNGIVIIGLLLELFTGKQKHETQLKK